MAERAGVSHDAKTVLRMTARAHEIDRYLAAVVGPAGPRDDLITLAAFVGEVARVPIMVSEPMIGQIRLQWWRDTIEAGAATGLSSGNPIADAFADVLRRRKLPVGLAIGVIDAQETLLDDRPPTDDEALRQHLAKAQGIPFEFAGRVLGAHTGTADQSSLASVWASAGMCYGLARTLLELAAVAAQGRTLLPAARLARASISPSLLNAPESAEAVGNVVRELMDEAHFEFTALMRQRATLSPAVRAALRPLSLVPAYLAKVERAGPSIARVPIDVMPLTRFWRIWRGI
ncbi:MAG: phytoene/squalene synthase family protein [Hyphomicrobiaceae bacterium]